MADKRTDRCELCIYAEKDGSSSSAYRCHRGPPIMCGGSSPEWACVWHEDWCGEFKPKEVNDGG